MAAAGGAGKAAAGGGTALLKMDPTEPHFVASTNNLGYSFSYHKISNTGKDKMALKVKCSDNRVYRLRPVFSMLDAGKDLTLTVARLPAPEKKDKLVILGVNVKADVNDPQVAWKGRTAQPDAQLTLNLTSKPAPGAPSPSTAPTAQPTAPTAPSNAPKAPTPTPKA